jgi:hypothetical protein
MFKKTVKTIPNRVQTIQTIKHSTNNTKNSTNNTKFSSNVNIYYSQFRCYELPKHMDMSVASFKQSNNRLSPTLMLGFFRRFSPTAVSLKTFNVVFADCI